jgi:predicted DCC family thiol-disulfide oxidoreductase YuxK
MRLSIPNNTKTEKKRHPVVSVELSQVEMETALRYAQYHCEHGAGTSPSHFHDAQTRQERLATDQAVGQVATAAVAKYLYGHTQPYLLTQMYHVLHRTRTDYGYDLGAINIDVKGSYMRGPSDPLRYNLTIPPGNVYPGWVYVQCLIQHPSEDPSEWLECLPTIHLPGYCTTADLPDQPEQNNRFAGNYRVSTSDLTPLPPLRYDWFGNGSQGEDSRVLDR